MDSMRRIIRIVLSPRAEWARIAGEHWHPALAYAAVLSLLPALAALAMVRTSEVVLSERAVAVTYALAFWLLGRLFEGRAATWGGGVRVAVYGATPLWISAVLLFSPLLVMVCMVALLHVFYLYYVGAQVVLGVREGEAAICVMLAMVLASAALTLAGSALGALALL
jgi:Yip1 domain